MKKFILVTLFAIIPVISHQEPLSEPQKVAFELGQQIECMAKNIYYEAASEPLEGKLAVAQVTMNRTQSSQFPSTVCGVVYQKGQFSWVDEKRYPIRSKSAWEECMLVARRALTEHKLHDTIYKTKSMYYHNNKVNPGWNLRYVTRIGNHIFYTNNANKK